MLHMSLIARNIWFFNSPFMKTLLWIYLEMLIQCMFEIFASLDSWFLRLRNFYFVGNLMWQ